MTPLPDSFLKAPITHRALHDRKDGRPENSLAAIRAAIAGGYGIEIDIQPSSDRQAMVFHDYDLRRLTEEHGPIAQRHAHELEAVTLTGGSEGIPTLKTVLELVAGQVPLLIEVKDQDGHMGPSVGALERSIAEVLENYEGDAALMSFNPHSIAVLSRLLPERPMGLVTCDYNAQDWPLLREETREHLRTIPDFERLGASFISHEAADLGADRVAELKSQGAKVLCWTIRSQAEEAEARKVAHNVTFEGYTPVRMP
ncbi:glycerophosphodiester phosphodiesterase family protein [Actibacterium pelagium]|uniref:Phosphodiesterase n=1 Tax=Actibacterium pelagium TaxID=2029103 RepID=A0A917AGA2_9RHOB|nr:glycerophosphodiester phosphodiesterase family protein [Actibacterium pelagium]GGE49777.1 phosphodiesterase [Actibacterium pelagium]